MGDMLSIMMSVLDDFRSVNVLFDANDKKQCIIFDLFANLKYRKIGFNIKLILFDSIAEKCLSSIIYK